jgi:hypothetical protein
MERQEQEAEIWESRKPRKQKGVGRALRPCDCLSVFNHKIATSVCNIGKHTTAPPEAGTTSVVEAVDVATTTMFAVVDDDLVTTAVTVAVGT